LIYGVLLVDADQRD